VIRAFGAHCQKKTFGQFHSITSSAVASNTGGTEIPSASAVLRLITRSNLSGRCIGKSLGLAPGFWRRNPRILGYVEGQNLLVEHGVEGFVRTLLGFAHTCGPHHEFGVSHPHSLSLPQRNS
jgi:hypothetical protein